MKEKTIAINEELHTKIKLQATKEKKSLKNKIEEIFEKEIAKEKEPNNNSHSIQSVPQGEGCDED